MSNTLTQKLQLIKNAKTQMDAALSAAYGPGTVLSDLVENVKAAATQVEETSAAMGLERPTACYITPNMADFISADNYYPNGSVAKAQYGCYMSYVYRADRDFDIWGRPEDLSCSVSNQNLAMTVYRPGYQPYSANCGQRYRVNTDGQPITGTGMGDKAYPTEDNPLHISAGQYILFSHDTVYGSKGSNWRPFLWRTNIPMPYSRQVPGGLAVQYRNTPKLYAEHDEEIRVLVPADDGYVCWSVERFKKDSINADCWHLGIMRRYDGDFVADDNSLLTNTGEIEMAIKLSGRPDYIGCKAHGDEIMEQTWLSVDGKPAQTSSLYKTAYCRTLSFRQRSRMYDPSLGLALSDVTDSTPYVAIHDKTLTFSGNVLSIDQSITWNGDFTVGEADLPMFTPRKHNVVDEISSVVTDAGYTDLSSFDFPHDWEQHSIPSMSINDMSALTIYGKESGFMVRMKCRQYVNGEPVRTRGSIRDNGGGNYNKCYFNMSQSGIGVTEAHAGDVWSSHAEIKIFA